jgi:SpoVK/Ycf46/Vps4 family AAA+-type ATPase
MIAHAIANHLNRNLIQIDYSEIESKYVGETSKNLVNAFSKAKETGSILLFDEADAILSRRESSMTNATDVSVNQTRSVLLTLMNDYNDIIVFTTNYIENFDPAFMRRIHSHINIGLPDEKSRTKLWGNYIPKNLPHDLNIESISKYSGVSGSDISNAVLLSAFRGAREKEKFVKHEYFEDSIKSIIESKSRNEKTNVKIEKREVSEEYAMKMMNKNKEEKL